MHCTFSLPDWLIAKNLLIAEFFKWVSDPKNSPFEATVGDKMAHQDFCSFAQQNTNSLIYTPYSHWMVCDLIFHQEYFFRIHNHFLSSRFNKRLKAWTIFFFSFENRNGYWRKKTCWKINGKYFPTFVTKLKLRRAICG